MEAGPAIQLQDQVARQVPALLAPLQQAHPALLALRLVHLFQPQRDHHLELQLKINIAQEHKLLLPHLLLNLQGTNTSTISMEIKEHPLLRLPQELLLKLSQAHIKLQQETPKPLQ